jgi:hypothetical protein
MAFLLTEIWGDGDLRGMSGLGRIGLDLNSGPLHGSKGSALHLPLGLTAVRIWKEATQIWSF